MSSRLVHIPVCADVGQRSVRIERQPCAVARMAPHSFANCANDCPPANAGKYHEVNGNVDLVRNPEQSLKTLAKALA